MKTQATCKRCVTGQRKRHPLNWRRHRWCPSSLGQIITAIHRLPLWWIVQEVFFQQHHSNHSHYLVVVLACTCLAFPESTWYIFQKKFHIEHCSNFAQSGSNVQDDRSTIKSHWQPRDWSLRLWCREMARMMGIDVTSQHAFGHFHTVHGVS